MDRRRWLGLTAIALAGGLAAGCASLAVRRRWEDTLAGIRPARISPDGVIRVDVGLRPYRSDGFVLRAESFAGKLLVHNYGHGGGGVTLSWGTADMAADLVTGGRSERGANEGGGQVGAGREGDVAVIGAGAVGLATARLLQRRGRAVTIYARDLPPNTTSNIAGAQWSPTSVADSLDGPFGVQFEEASRRAHRHFQTLVGPDYGVRWIDNYFLSERQLGIPGYMARIRDLYPELEDLEGDEHPFPTRFARRVVTMFIEPPRYLRAVMRDFRAAGGRVIVGEIADRGQLAGLAEPVIVNCTGLGARDLFGDDGLVPVKGQLVALRPQPELDYLTIGGGSFSRGGSQYMFPRADGVLLGGTFDRGEETLQPDARQTDRILQVHGAFFDAMARKIGRWQERRGQRSAIARQALRPRIRRPELRNF